MDATWLTEDKQMITSVIQKCWLYIDGLID